MPEIIGKAVRVVEHDGLTVDEYVGNVSTSSDEMSVAHVKVTSPMSEPWLTLDYDEWICVLSGQMDVHYISDGGVERILTVKGGETCKIGRGKRFRPVFPLGHTEYIPICKPAFAPHRYKRDEYPELSAVAQRIREIHAGRGIASQASSSAKSEGSDGGGGDASSAHPKDSEEISEAEGSGGDGGENNVLSSPRAPSCATPDHMHQPLYHMCRKDLWEEAAKKDEGVYFPPTFEKDGRFTHATAVPARLLEIANHFYMDDKGEWICVEVCRTGLKKIGIETVFEQPKPVGGTDVRDSWDSWVCPHILGGIPTNLEGVVVNIFPINRDKSGRFLCIKGVTDFDQFSNTMNTRRRVKQPHPPVKS